MENDSDVYTFMSLTGASKDEADNMLEACAYDLQKAIDLFLPSTTVAKRNNRPQENLYDEDYVRSPDAVKRQRLIETYVPSRPLHAPSPIPVSVFGTGSTQGLSEKEEKLSNLYKPPFDILTQGTFLEVRNECKSSGKWMLVNIQSEEEFACHILNRDIWSDETVKEIIQCSFLFWQQQSLSVEGKLYYQRYQVKTTPHIAIIDPRTGGIVYKHEGPAGLQIMEKLLDFVSSHPTFEHENINNKNKTNTNKNNNNDRDNDRNNDDNNNNNDDDIGDGITFIGSSSLSSSSSQSQSNNHDVSQQSAASPLSLPLPLPLPYSQPVATNRTVSTSVSTSISGSALGSQSMYRSQSFPQTTQNPNPNSRHSGSHRGFVGSGGSEVSVEDLTGDESSDTTSTSVSGAVIAAKGFLADDEETFPNKSNITSSNSNSNITSTSSSNEDSITTSSSSTSTTNQNTKIQMKFLYKENMKKIVHIFDKSDSVLVLLDFVRKQIILSSAYRQRRFDILFGFPSQSLYDLLTLTPNTTATTTTNTTATTTTTSAVKIQSLLPSLLTIESLGLSSGTISVRFFD